MNFDQACINYSSVILIIDPETGDILSANNKASTTYGYTVDQLSSMNISDINILSKSEILKEMKFAQNERVSFFHCPHKTSDGTIIQMEVESHPTTIDGKIFLFSTINPYKNKSHFNTIATNYFSNYKDAILVINHLFEIVNYNDNFKNSFCNMSDDIKGKLLSYIININEPLKVSEFNNRLKDGYIGDIDISLDDCQSKIHYYNVLGFPTYFRDKFFGAIVFFRNKTKETIKENKKSEIYKKALIKTEMYRNQKEQLFSRMSHNMRTPLTAIIAFSEFGEKENNVEKLKEYFNQINRSSEYLLKLVNDILNMNKIESGSIKLVNTPICKTQLIENILQMINIQAKAKNVKIITKFDSKMWPYHKFDITRLEQVYLNLLQNAVKYSPVGGTVTWTKKYLKDKDGKPYFRNKITDNGVGISEEFQKIMFEPYTQDYSNPFNDKSDSGLGLTITKSILQMLNGKIWCESKKGIGTSIYFELPANEISEEEYLNYVNQKENTKQLSNKKVLICEDNTINTKIISKIIQSYGMSFDTAENGLIGLEKAKVNNYFAILMDLQMPIMDGITSTKAIREFNKTVPIIAISANSYHEDIQNCIKAGMNEHISKPIDQHKLFKTLAQFI